MPIVSTRKWHMLPPVDIVPPLRQPYVRAVCDIPEHTHWVSTRFAPNWIRDLLARAAEWDLLARDAGWDSFVRWAAKHALEKTAYQLRVAHLHLSDLY